jgi:hypothetical protein
MEAMVIGFRQLFFVIISILVSLGVSSANDVFVSQTPKGSGSGADCADALAVSYFNSSSNWTSSTATGTKIGPGTTVHLCGTITTNLTFQGSGSSGNPVVLDGTGATMSAYINNNQQYWTIQNLTWSTNYGTYSQTQAIIQTFNGAAFGTIQNNHIDVLTSAQVVFLGAMTHDVTVQNNYMKITVPTASGLDVDILDTEGSYNVTVQGNYLAEDITSADNPNNNCHDDLIQTWAASNSSSNYPYNWTIRYNYFAQLSPGKNNNQQMLMLQSISASGYFNVYSNIFDGVSGGSQSAMVNTYGHAPGAALNFYNNTFVQHAGSYGNMMLLESVGTYNLTNNIIYASDSSTMELTNEGATINRSKNLWYGGNSPSCSNTTDICGRNPLFTSFAGSDFSLQSGSPAVNAGANLGTNFNHYPLPETTWPNPALGTRASSGAWDVGAFDPNGQSAAVPPAPPTGLNAVVQ